MANEPFQISAIGGRRQRDAQTHGCQRARGAGTRARNSPLREKNARRTPCFYSRSPRTQYWCRQWFGTPDFEG
jgi:hypothetical protein